jgi:hypothetical protein
MITAVNRLPLPLSRTNAHKRPATDADSSQSRTMRGLWTNDRGGAGRSDMVGSGLQNRYRKGISRSFCLAFEAIHSIFGHCNSGHESRIRSPLQVK